jgi:mannosyltransferase
MLIRRQTTVAAAGLAGLLLLSLVLRTGALDGSLWIDEALSLGIASHPAGEIPAILRQDGSPPLYYLALHAWMGIVGSGEAAARCLSLAAALLTVPAALWAGWSLFGRRAGWLAALLATVSPFLTVYAQEARMYALLVLLGLLTATAFLHAFVFGRRRYAPALAALMVLVLYTHNWALFLMVGLAAALLVALGRRRRPALAHDAALAAGVAALAYLPWVPTLAFQAGHTGAPWANPPALLPALAALALGAGAPLLARLGRGPEERRALAALAALAAATMMAGWLAALAEPMWASRYLAVIVGPLLLLGGALLARLGRAGLVVAAAVAAVWCTARPTAPQSNVAATAAALHGTLGPGDLVLSTQPEQVPALAYYLPRGPSYATPLGRVADPRVTDWRDALERLSAATPRIALTPLLDALPVGRRLLLVRPLVEDPRRWRAPWTRLVRARSAEWALALSRDRRFRAIPVAVSGALGARVNVSVVLFRKERAA